MSAPANFKIEIEDYIAWLTLNRPEKRNAMGMSFFEEIGARFDEFDRNPDIRVVIIKAEGKSFSAGTDLKEAAALVSQRSADGRDKMQQSILTLQMGLTKIERCRKPVIAAVHSHCVGGGMDMICACDMRLATKDAIFSVRETRMGIVADLGTLQRLPHKSGDDHTVAVSLTRPHRIEQTYQCHLQTCGPIISQGHELVHQLGRRVAPSELAGRSVNDVVRFHQRRMGMLTIYL